MASIYQRIIEQAEVTKQAKQDAYRADSGEAQWWRDASLWESPGITRSDTEHEALLSILNQCPRAMGCEGGTRSNRPIIMPENVTLTRIISMKSNDELLPLVQFTDAEAAQLSRNDQRMWRFVRTEILPLFQAWDRAAEATQKAYRALFMRSQGKPYYQIAKTLGYSDESGARKAVNRLLASSPHEDASMKCAAVFDPLESA